MLKIFTRIPLAHVTFPVMPRSVTDTIVSSGAELMTSVMGEAFVFTSLYKHSEKLFSTHPHSLSVLVLCPTLEAKRQLSL